jgi:hypothetical protein
MKVELFSRATGKVTAETVDTAIRCGDYFVNGERVTQYTRDWANHWYLMLVTTDNGNVYALHSVDFNRVFPLCFGALGR